MAEGGLGYRSNPDDIILQYNLDDITLDCRLE
jgi:hypothetical protein